MSAFVALLRGINVGGKNIIKMADLQAAFEKNGYTNVKTYIQSGNVIFTSTEKNTAKLEKDIEQFLSKTFNYQSTVLVRSAQQMKNLIASAPTNWARKNDLRKYVAFIKEPPSAGDAAKEIELKEGVDSLAIGPGALYLSTPLSGIMKSKISKLITKKIYQRMTLRNYNTTQKLAELLQGGTQP
ncbi:DUF1697 domain-containing protein [Candidatus Woesearchaeota archaeon]|nr:MAG: DUF1697 domain-containing protein [Candidatus Woesearchaeota archaeon]